MVEEQCCGEVYLLDLSCCRLDEAGDEALMLEQAAALVSSKVLRIHDTKQAAKALLQGRVSDGSGLKLRVEWGCETRWSEWREAIVHLFQCDLPIAIAVHAL